MPKQATVLVVGTLALLQVSTLATGVAVANFTRPERPISRPPAVAAHVPVGTGAVRPAAGADAPVPDPAALARRLNPLLEDAGTRIGAVVTDAATGRVLFASRADEPATPASTTK
ncbi:D-alanyl-D-alanine carboxypeptidase/D-alanyl-D-alanine-endopeptidase, partial [Actinomadura adrarensis]